MLQIASNCRYLDKPCDFFFDGAPNPNFCVPSQLVSWSAQPLEPPSETYVSCAARHVINERKEVLNDGFVINNLIGSKEFCPVCDTFSSIVATTIPIHAREKSFNSKLCSLWRAKRNVEFCGSSHNRLLWLLFHRNLFCLIAKRL